MHLSLSDGVKETTKKDKASIGLSETQGEKHSVHWGTTILLGETTIMELKQIFWLSSLNLSDLLINLLYI
jgi:hypothetical protein